MACDVLRATPDVSHLTFSSKEEGERVRPPFILKSSSGGGSSSKIQMAISDWSKNLSADSGGTTLIMPMFSADVSADVATVVKTLMAFKVVDAMFFFEFL